MSGRTRFLPAGLDVLLVEVGSLDEAIGLFRALRSSPIRGVHELIPAARTVMVRYWPTVIDRATLEAEIADRATVGAAREEPGDLVHVPVRYDGEDLDEVAEATRLSRDEVVRLHTSRPYTVAFTGFAPGFAYLVGGPPELQVPRRSEPRTMIPAGSVGLAGAYSGVYPRTSPGGWQLIGTTSLPMFDPDREPAALLRPGMRVQFERETTAPVAHNGSGSPSRARLDASGAGRAEPASALIVEAPGAQTTIQDLGRPGVAAMGVSPSGALDRASLRRANRLVGNDSDAAALEVAGGGLKALARGELVVAVTGALLRVAVIDAGGVARREPASAPIPIGDGERLELGFAKSGAVAYVAVRGGLAVPATLGSCSTDVLSGLGPEPLESGSVVPIGRTARHAVAAGLVGPDDHSRMPRRGEVVTLDVILGPRVEMFEAESVRLLLQQEWEVSPRSNRVGLRLVGESPLQRRDHTELASEGTVAGAIEVPSNGQPVLFMADHPVTGGYPVIASVASYHLDLAGQVPAGARLRFRVVTPPARGSAHSSSAEPEEE